MNEDKEARGNCQIRKKVPEPCELEEKEICDGHVFLTVLQSGILITTVDIRKLTRYFVCLLMH